MPIIYGNWENGIGESKYQQDAFDDLSNVDIMTEPGLAQCNKALAKESGSSVAKPVVMCRTRTGMVYMFSTSDGTIYKRTTTPTYSALASNSFGAHMDCTYYDDWVYYVTASKIGQFQTDAEASRDDDKLSFYYTDATDHPIGVINNLMFIGDKKRLAVVDSHSDLLSSGIISLQTKQNIVCLKPFGYDLLVFTRVASSVMEATIFRYDTASVSWSSEDTVEASGIRIVIPSSTTDRIYFVAGDNGDLYEYDGVRAIFYRKIREVGTIPSSKTNQLSTTYEKKALFAIGGTIYGLVSPIAGGQPALTKEFVCSAGTNATITSILGGVSNNLLVAWTSGSTYGIDNISTNYATATIDTPLFMGRSISDIRVYYDTLPTGSTIGISVKNDNGSWVAKDTIVDSIHKVVKLKARPGNKRMLQARITLTPNNTGTPATPKVQYIEFVP